VRGNYQDAARSFAQGYQTYPKSQKAADSLLKLGLSLAKMNKKDDACLSFKQLEKEFAGDNGPVMRRAQSEERTLGCR
jgi:TolA-binding protein